jgi:hypothetical protein
VDRTFTHPVLRGVHKRLLAKVEVARISAEIKAADSEVVRCFRRGLSKLKGAPAALKRHFKAGLLSRASSVEPSSASANEPNAACLPKEMTDSLTSSLPIVFIHRSNSAYLKYSLSQAQATNPRSPVILIGDRSNDCYDFVVHREIDEFFQGAAEFENIYTHFSTQSPSFELICFQRWFILRDFLLANKIPRCLYLDSDTMLYTDVTQDSEKFAHFDFTLSHQTSGCTFFLNRVEALAGFCQFLMDVYSKKDRYFYDKLVAHYAVTRRHGLKGGVCDMTAFQLYGENHFGEIGEVAHIIDESVYDPAITISRPGFEMEGGVKKIVWRNDLPYGKHLRTGREIRFNSLQFHGSGSKSLISQFYTGKLY